MTREKGLAPLIVIILVAIFLLVAYFLFFQGLLKPSLDKQGKQLPNPRTDLKQFYQNPFVEKSEYQNPFEDLK